jgi:hypothetical protein
MQVGCSEDGNFITHSADDSFLRVALIQAGRWVRVLQLSYLFGYSLLRTSEGRTTEQRELCKQMRMLATLSVQTGPEVC